VVKTIGNVQKDAQVRAVASGALSNGDTIIVNSDGTVSAVLGTDTGAGTSSVISTESNLSEVKAAYDPDSGKVVIVYHRDANAYYGAAVVGTISGDTISFGSITKFQPNNTQGMQGVAVTYDTNTDKIFISYADKNNSTYMTGVVGTVSGTSISFGTPTVFYSESGGYTNCAFDSTNNKILVVWRRGNAFGAAKVVTISGSSFSSGSAVNFNTGNIGIPNLAFSTTAGKFVLVYKDGDQSGNGRYIVATISGTGVSFGTEGSFNNVSSLRESITYDSSTDKFVAVYMDRSASDAGKARVGTLSGTTVTWGSITVFNTGATTFPTVLSNGSGTVMISYVDVGNSNYPTFVVADISGTTLDYGTYTEHVIKEVAAETGAILGASYMTYDSANDKFVFPFNNVNSSNQLEASVLSIGSTNLTSDNFIGFADGAYADTQSAAINSTCSVDLNQTGLTAGQKYYVQTDGTLSTTAGSPTVEAGTAISPTKILVKG